MGFKRSIAPVAVRFASLLAAAPACGASAGGRDLYLVPPSQNAVVQFASPYGSQAEDPLDQAIRNFGRAMNQAAMADEQKIQEHCRTGAPASASTQERYAWAASCRYSRR